MPLPRTAADARMLSGMLQFNASATIQQATQTRSTTGDVVTTWADVPGLVALTCHFYQPTGKRGGSEQRTPDGTFLDAFQVCVLQGSYPQITEAMRLVVAGVAYDIKIASTDSQAIATTIAAELIR